jgi:hypothetical protein
VVCGDAGRSVSAGDFGAPIETFFEELSNRKDNTVYRLIESYAAQDAAAAFHIAVLCNIDILEKLPHVVIDNCDQPAFLGIALQRASQEPERFELWSHALAEALLRSAAVAGSLSRSMTDLWTAKAELVPTRKRWDSAPFSRTPDMKCLSCACYFGSPSAQIHATLASLKIIRAPGQRWFSLSHGAALMSNGFLIPFLAIIGFVFFYEGPREIVVFFLGQAMAACFLFAGFCVQFIQRTASKWYRSLVRRPNLLYRVDVYYFNTESRARALAEPTVRYTLDITWLERYFFRLLFNEEERQALKVMSRIRSGMS